MTLDLTKPIRDGEGNMVRIVADDLGDEGPLLGIKYISSSKISIDRYTRDGVPWEKKDNVEAYLRNAPAETIVKALTGNKENLVSFIEDMCQIKAGSRYDAVLQDGYLKSIVLCPEQVGGYGD